MRLHHHGCLLSRFRSSHIPARIWVGVAAAGVFSRVVAMGRLISESIDVQLFGVPSLALAREMWSCIENIEREPSRAPEVCVTTKFARSDTSAVVVPVLHLLEPATPTMAAEPRTDILPRSNPNCVVFMRNECIHPWSARWRLRLVFARVSRQIFEVRKSQMSGSQGVLPMSLDFHSPATSGGGGSPESTWRIRRSIEERPPHGGYKRMSCIAKATFSTPRCQFHRISGGSWSSCIE